jgi:chemotaxis protein methyltransferase CheR
MASFLSEQEFESFRTLIYDESGIHFSESNRTILESRLKERLRSKKLEKVSEYHSIIKSSPEELKVLLDSVTTNLTRFFRNTSHFDTLEHYVLPEFVEYKKKQGSNKLKVWSAGCSTGEEPYSLAIFMKELLPPSLDFEITASDLSLKSLMTAQEGFYPDSRVNGIPPENLEKYFDRETGGYRIKQDLKKHIKFDYHNLKFDSGQRNLDLVFCRNVIIYFDEAAQRNVIEKFWNSMNNHSYLFIGHSESLFGMNTGFEFLKTDWACIYRKFKD